MRWNGRRLPRLWSTEAWLRRHSFDSHKWINRRTHIVLTSIGLLLSGIFPSFALPYTSINCYQNLPETQTQQNAGNFLENYFVILFTMQHRFNSGCNKFRYTCSMFVFVALNVICPAKADDVNGRHTHTQVGRALSIACTHNHPFAEVASPTEHKRTRCLCSQPNRHCFQNIVDFNWLWRCLCRYGKVFPSGFPLSSSSICNYSRTMHWGQHERK